MTYDFNKIKAIIGLGNPGGKYTKTRHNIGFRVVEQLADRYGAQWKASDLMDYAQVQLDTRSIYLVKPMTFMNNSGQVLPFLRKKGILPAEILVVHDELEKGLGKLGLKFGGSARGHNGLRSIQGAIGQDFWRLRFGIGRPEEKSDVSRYVLSPFRPDEEVAVAELVDRAISLVEGDQ